jgi:hypothetical protein
MTSTVQHHENSKLLISFLYLWFKKKVTKQQIQTWISSTAAKPVQRWWELSGLQVQAVPLDLWSGAHRSLRHKFKSCSRWHREIVLRASVLDDFCSSRARRRPNADSGGAMANARRRRSWFSTSTSRKSPARHAPPCLLPSPRGLTPARLLLILATHVVVCGRRDHRPSLLRHQHQDHDVRSLRSSSSTTTASHGGALEKGDGGCHGEMCEHREGGSGHGESLGSGDHMRN